MAFGNRKLDESIKGGSEMDQGFGISEPIVLLAEVEKAIRKILNGGQSYKIGTRSVTRADLSTLLSMRESLKAETETTEDGFLGRVSVAYFDRR